jgi:hypothetical protein
MRTRNWNFVYGDELVLLTEEETVLQCVIGRMIDILKKTLCKINEFGKNGKIIRFPKQPSAVHFVIDNKK